MKIFKIILASVLLLSILYTGIYANAEIVGDSIYFYDENITIKFNPDDSLDDNRKLFIANALVYGAPKQTRAWCWLTGHSLREYTLTSLKHRVEPLDPRCLRSIYDVTVCDNCDYYEEVLLTSVLVSCCPKD